MKKTGSSLWHWIAVGVFLFVCGLGFVARDIATPIPLPPPAASAVESPRISPASIRIPASMPEVELEVPFQSESPSSLSADRTDSGLLLVRQCLALAEMDPLAAMEMAEANGLYEIDSGLSASLMALWAKQDFARAYEWTKTQEPGAWRDEMLACLVYLRAQTDPAAAARLVVKDVSAGPARDEAIMSVIHQWALKDPRGAGFWAHSFPEQPLRERAIAEIDGITASTR